VDRSEVQLDSLYREVVMDHYRRPRGREPLARVDARAHGFNPVCGDEVHLAVALDDDRIEGVEIQGRGCAICTASGSIMAELLPGRTISEAHRAAAAFRGLMHGEGLPDGDWGDLEALEGVCRFVVRVKCAMLPWVTLEDALAAGGSEPPEATTEAPDRAGTPASARGGSGSVPSASPRATIAQNDGVEPAARFVPSDASQGAPPGPVGAGVLPGEGPEGQE